MGSIFGNTTKTAVQSGGAAPQYYDNPADVVHAVTSQSKAPLTTAVSGGDLNNPTMTPVTTGGVSPTVTKQTFQQATTDKDGNAIIGSGLTKRGVLLGILKSGLQGASDAVEGGALNVRPGQSSFGTGFQAAAEAPRRRMLENLQDTRLQQEAQIQENNLKNAPLLFQQGVDLKNSEIADNKARAGWYAAGAEKRGQDQFKFIPGVGLKNLSTNEITDRVPVAKITPKDEIQLRFMANDPKADPADRQVAQSTVDDLEASRQDLTKTIPGKAPSTTNIGAVTTTAAKLLQRNGMDVNATLADFNNQLANSNNPDLQRDAKAIIAGIKAGASKGPKKKPTLLFNNTQPVTP